MKNLPPMRMLTASLALYAGMMGTPAMSWAQGNASTTAALLDKAHSLEVKGRMDMAAQTWQQVLLADPNNPEALGGLARAAKLAGNQQQAKQYLDRLRAVSPNDPNIERAENMMTQQNQLQQLQQAGKLAQAGQYAQAMNIYRQVFGGTPPPGDWALAYYETESATEDGRPHAIAGLRSLIDKYPQDSRYQIALGRILTYNPATRAEGRRYLERHPNDPGAMEALRQSLTWDAQNPAALSDIRAYLAKHKDPALETAMKSTQARVAASVRTGARTAAQGPAMTPEQQAEIVANRQVSQEEQAAYAALNGKRLTDAEERFKALLAKNPDNPRALAGMGYIRMQQSNFGGAISFLEQAKQDGARDAGLENALSTSRFWYTMGEGTSALNESDLTTAEKHFRAALDMKPGSPEALEGLAGTLMKAQQPEAAAPYYEQYIKLRASGITGWRGLFTAQYQAGNAALALATERKMPAGVRAQLMKDPDFLRTLASAYSAVGRDADAQRVLKGALELPFPADGRGIKIETQLQYAGLLLAGNHMDQAAGLYRQVLSEDAANVAAWQGLVRVEHAMKNDALAEQTLESMPPSAYDQALRDPGFVSTVAAVYDAQNKLDIAQDMLEKAVSQASMAGQKPSVAMQTELAGIYMKRGNAQQAYAIYRQVLTENPDRLDSWKGLLTALHASGHDQEALAQVQQIPQQTRKQLELDPEYLQTVGGIYGGLGQPQQAMVFLQRVQQHYARQNMAPPADIDIQDAWLLYNSQNDSGLYRQLMMIGSRNDLNEEQRRTVQTIWANWAVRRANQAVAANNIRRALAILNAAAKAFPDNPAVIRALATGYARAGQPKQAVAIFRSQDMTTASATDYKAAIGAALAANDTKNAETWLRYGLDQYPKDAQMLILAAKFEQARGDSERAADYYKASLNAMPPGDPGAELAAEMSLAAQNGGRLPNATQAMDLAQLMAPGSDAAMVTGQIAAPAPPPYLPSYSNQYGTAPVQLQGNGAPPNGTLVPSYMTNPAYQQQRTPARPGTTTRLKDYIPQAEANPALAPFGQQQPEATAQSALPAFPQTDTNGNAVNANDYMAYQREQIRRLTEQAVNGAGPLSAYGPPAQQQARGEVYGPYVPFNPQSVNQNAAYMAQAAPVDLGSDLQPIQPKMQQPTDVVPTAKYVPNSRRTGRLPSSSSHPDIAAAEAAATRRRQSDPRPLVGTSHPPQDPIDVAPLTQTQYNGQPYNAAQTQIPQPQGGTGSAVQAPQTQQNYQYRGGLAQNAGAATGTESYGQQYPQPVRRPATTGRRTVRSRSVEGTSTGPQQAPLFYPGVPVALSGQPYPDLGPSYPLQNPPTDPMLLAKNVPPLRGSWDRTAALTPGPPLSERQQAELDLASLEASYSSWIGATALARYRSGISGMNRLFDLESPFEATLVANKTLRLSIIPRAVFLNAGSLDLASYQNASGTVPILGTLPLNAINQPSQQLTAGLGGEAQLVTTNMAVSVGFTPYEFLVTNVIGHGRWRPFGGHFLLFADRDNVKDTQLSYSGMRDPGSATPVFAGNIWGGVVSTGGGLRLDFGNERAGFYVSAAGASLTGFHVLDNRKFEGTVGSYWRVKQFPGYGSLNLGASFFGMHYDNNQRGMTYGMGGYFSPNAYFLGAMPVTFNGFYGTNWHYTIAGAVGVQSFQEAYAKYYPLDTSLQTGAFSGCTLPSIAAHTCGEYPVNTSTGLNYSLNSEMSYRIADHWYVGGILNGNNTNNYNTITAGFFFRYLFKPQVPTEDYPTGLFPYDGFRPLRVP
ncbi:cellulose synthase subunit BcsC-related outer membrane protein [Terriglobus albidus]|uniref:cellulose synthase subunit BcsC-related outer membrane protein n=1 Tax=Terriglobus albidus TaxID=1592106 RepID=UPI0021E07398|nr:cellulose synthase subunit BcsC-related outer membrane protein [Terriglobus albidus]